MFTSHFLSALALRNILTITMKPLVKLCKELNWSLADCICNSKVCSLNQFYLLSVSLFFFSESAQYDKLALTFPGNIAKTKYCEVKLTEEALKAFDYAVKNHYWYQMFMDDLPVWGEFTENMSQI